VGPRTQDLDPELILGPARCRAAVLTAPGKVPHASNRSQLSMTKDPKINNWIHNSPITGFKTHLQSQPAPACRRRGSQSCPLASNAAGGGDHDAEDDSLVLHRAVQVADVGR
jgi:hypothetical protein